MSQALRRSKTAPEELPALVKTQLARSASQTHISKSLGSFTATTPRAVDQDDPFSLAGFFPRSDSAWTWLKEEPDGMKEEEEVEPVESVEDLSNLDELIAQEDKMGVLSLEPGRLFGDGRMISPYVFSRGDDEPVDHETLWLSLRARRQRNTESGKELARNKIDYPGLFSAERHEPEQTAFSRILTFGM